MSDPFLKDEAESVRRKVAMEIVKDPSWDLEERYKVDYSFQERELTKATDCRTTAEMLSYLETDRGKKAELAARVLAFREGEDGNEYGQRKLNRERFKEAYLAGNRNRTRAFREGFGGGGGGYGGDEFSSPTQFGNTVGNDFTPLLGGPFYKQLYYYTDWLRAHQDQFFAFHHDPYAKATHNIMVDFTLGKGYEVECKNGAAQVIWDAFEQANQEQAKMRMFAQELSVYGEDIFWWLPQRQIYIDFATNATSSVFNPNKATDKSQVPTGLLPRVRLVDPSNIVEIITYPEDIDRRIAYVWMTPTQYQIFTGTDPATGKQVGTEKFIYQQIPASEMMHIAINRVSNEKRGRGDAFAALPYFKRLRDSINYSLIAQQKNAAYCMDTTIDGDEGDLSSYMAAQAALGSIPPAGSEFVHTKAVERKYNASAGSDSGKTAGEVFQVGLSMVAAATGIPVSYYGSHLSSGGTRASAIVATEPVAKRFEMRQEVYKDVIRQKAERLFRMFGIESEVDVYFPEIVTQDRSAKLKDLTLAEQNRWISPKRAATSAVKELGFSEYTYEKEVAEIKAQQAEEIPLPGANPLTAPPTAGGGEGQPNHDSETAITQDEKKSVNDSRGF